MSEFQFILLLLAITIFVIFFKQILSGNHPKRGIDYEAKIPNNSIGGVSRPDKIFKKETPQPEVKSRSQELYDMAKEAIEKGDKEEAKKALNALIIREADNTDALRILGTIELEEKNYKEAKKYFEKVLEYDETDDLTHNHLANTLQKLKEDEKAIKHHEIAIKLDEQYAPYYYNYANTLYELQRFDEALSLYKKALELDPTLKSAKNMISEIENGSDK